MALFTSILNNVTLEDIVQTVNVDIAIVGAGGGGLRSAIAAAEANPNLKIALISKVYPMRSHTVAAEGGAAAVIKDEDSYDKHFHDTVGVFRRTFSN